MKEAVRSGKRIEVRLTREFVPSSPLRRQPVRLAQFVPISPRRQVRLAQSVPVSPLREQPVRLARLVVQSPGHPNLLSLFRFLLYVNTLFL